MKDLLDYLNKAPLRSMEHKGNDLYDLDYYSKIVFRNVPGKYFLSGSKDYNDGIIYISKIGEREIKRGDFTCADPR